MPELDAKAQEAAAEKMAESRWGTAAALLPVVEEAVTAYLQAAIPDGYVLVPREPTQCMKRSGFSTVRLGLQGMGLFPARNEGRTALAVAVYKAMLAAHEKERR